MQIIQRFGLSDAPRCVGDVVVIDVLRAFTTAAYAIGQKADRVIVVAGIDEAFALRKLGPRVVLVGEDGGRPIVGFDFGNSPAAIARADLSGATVILRSGNGTQGVAQAAGADRVLLGSFVVASATARFLRTAAADPVTLLAMGSEFPGSAEGDEDVACADALASLLRGEKFDRDAAHERVMRSPAGQRALDPSIDWITPEDLACATEIDRFDFAMPVVCEDGLWAVKPSRRSS